MADTIVNKQMPSLGDMKVLVVDHVGPASYTQVNVSTGAGDTVKLPPGLGRGEYIVIGGVSDDGLNAVDPIPPANSGFAASNKWILKWVVISTSTEVAGAVNLSSRHVRLLVIPLG